MKADFDKEGNFFWFYVSIQLERQAGDVTFDRIALVEYHLLDDTIPEPNVRVTNSKDGFEYRMWLYGFIKVSADIITRDGKLIKVPVTRLTWAATDEEKQANGQDELSW